MNKNDLLEKLSFLTAEAFWHGLEEISPGPLLRERLRREGEKILVSGRPWDGRGRLLCCAAGKAAPEMARVAGEILEGKAHRGLLICPADLAPGRNIPGFEILPAEHPVPGEGSLRAAGALKAAAKELKAGDLFLFLLSGGATTLLASPVPPITPEELSATFKALLSSGADIVDMNVVRKHLTELGGGRLAELAYPARIETLAVSDVPTDNPSTIGSGPTMDDFSTYALAVGIIERYGLSSRIPENVLRFLKDGIRGKNPETPKKGAPCFLSSRFEILCSARLLLDKMALHLALLPQVAVWETGQVGSIRYQVERHVKELLRRKSEGNQFPLAVLSAGECQSPIPENPGQGGRAAHFALAFALEAERAGLSPYVLLSGASDGRDGSGEAAGAILTHETLPQARKAGVRPEKYLERFDSHSFFREMGALLPAKNTGTNVSDARVMLTW